MFITRMNFLHAEALGALDLGFLAQREPVVTRCTFDQVAIGSALPRAGQIDGLGDLAFLIFMLDHEAAAELLGEVADHAFDQVRHLLKIGVGPVSLKHGELRIVTAADAFVAEVAVEFEHTGETAHEQPFQIQLGGDAQIHLLIERIEVSLKRARSGTAGHVLHHRCFDFQEVAAVQVVADLGDHLAARDEDLATAVVGNEVQVALAIFDLAIRDTMPLVGKRAQCFRQRGEHLHMDGVLASFGHESLASHTDEVADVDLMNEERVGFLADITLAQVALDASRDVADVKERRLAHLTPGQNAACHIDIESFDKVFLQRARIV